MKTTFIATVFNEEKTIAQFIDSILLQSKQPDEIIIVDGGSRDGTVAKMQNAKVKSQKFKLKVKIFVKVGNRSVGRNEAIKRASGDVILCSDAGCILDKNWVKNIIEPFTDSKVDVVAGYYRGIVKNIFQKCLTPYVLVMPDKIDPKNFLPASRSMAFRKTIWEKAGRFDEKYSHNEDYVFARKLKSIGAKIVFAKDAIVNWLPRETVTGAFHMFYRFARGDMEAGILRPKVILLFIRYLLGIGLLVLLWTFDLNFCLLIFAFLLIVYCIWAIAKNYRYVQDIRAFVILPLLQLTSDLAVITGSIHGIYKRRY